MIVLRITYEMMTDTRKALLDPQVGKALTAGKVKVVEIKAVDYGHDFDTRDLQVVLDEDELRRALA